MVRAHPTLLTSERHMHHDFQLAAFIAVCAFVTTLMALYLHNL